MPFEPAIDPFPGKGPIPTGDPSFYPLQEVLSSIEVALAAGSSICLIGERKAGKTSFLNHLLAYLPIKGFVPVLIDVPLIAPRTDKMFLAGLVRGAARATQYFRGLTDLIEIETINSSSENCYEAFLKDLEVLGSYLSSDSKSDTPLVWLIDEIDVLRTYKNTNLFNFLRSVIIAKSRFRMVVTGYDVLTMPSEYNDWTLLMTAFGHISRLEGFSPTTAQRLISDGAKLMGITFDENLYEPIMSWTGRKPFYIKWALSDIAKTINNQKQERFADSNVWSEAKECFLNETEIEHHLEFLWTHLTSNQQQILSLMALHSDIIYDHSTILNDLKENQLLASADKAEQYLIADLTRLKQLAFLYEQAGRYTFTSECLMDWIRENKPI
jgi:hypothetical protein